MSSRVMLKKNSLSWSRRTSLATDATKKRSAAMSSEISKERLDEISQLEQGWMSYQNTKEVRKYIDSITHAQYRELYEAYAAGFLAANQFLKKD